MQQALTLIAKAKRTRATRLDLGNCGLTELPKALFELTWLEELILSEEWWEYNPEKEESEEKECQNKGIPNRINSISGIEDLGALKKLVIAGQYEKWALNDLSPLSVLSQLQTLLCSSTQVSDLSPLSALTQLQTLDCSRTPVSDLSPLSALIQLQTLDCSDMPVSDLSPLSTLTQLKTLICSETQVSDLSALSTLIQLQRLDCRHTPVNDLTSLSALLQLQTLICVYTKVGDLSPLSKLTQLQRLHFSSMQVKDLSPLSALTQLMTLECSGTPVSDLSPLSTLVQLQTLYCSNTQVIDLSPLKTLTKLHTLDCSSTHVIDLAPLSALTQLQWLNCCYTQVSDLSPLRTLANLQTLDSCYTQVSDLSPLKVLKQLQWLDFSSTHVIDLLPLKALPQLQWLSFSSTHVTDLLPLSALTQLQTLLCQSTHVSDLSPLKALANLQGLSVSGCPIQNIPKEIYDQVNCARDLYVYWDALKTAQSVQNKQLKVMFLGNGCVGKSTLLHWFLNGEFTPISLEKGRTHGIFIKPYTFPDSEVLAHFWDFGGQEVFHATHRLFLGRRSLYVLVWATESPEFNQDYQHPPQYWLDMIADIADRHERSRVLIVQNLFERQKERNILSDAERADYESRGLDITTYCVNAKSGLRVKTVMTAIEEEAVQLINIHREELPETWVNIRATVAKRRFEGEKMLKMADFEAICHDCLLPANFSVMLDYLHRAGELFYYRDHFENRIILDQEWALKAVYAILKRKNIDTFKGRMRREQLIDMWKNDAFIQYGNEADVFLDFMMANQIAFYTEEEYWDIENPELAIPQLLPPEPPRRRQTWEKIGEKKRHRIAYNFLHRDLIERFIVRAARLSKDKIEDIWRNGLFIEYGLDGEALIEVVTIEDKKQIQIECVGATRQVLLQKIREEFNQIRTLVKAVEWMEENGQWVVFSEKIRLEPGETAGFELPSTTPIEMPKMFNMNMKEYLLNLIAEGKLKEALDTMRQIEDSQSKYFKDPLIGYLSRYNRNERDNNSGILDKRDYQIEYNKIEAAVKSLLDSEFKEERVPEALRRQIVAAGNRDVEVLTKNNPNLSNKPKVYFSYAWGDDKEVADSREKIVQDLYEELKKEGYPVRRDKEDVGYKDSIEEFMREIGRGSFIVVTISDKYLKSANCMFELLQIYRKSNSDFSEFKDKIFPIVLEDAKIYDPLDVLDYATHWQDKKNKLEEKIKVVGLAAASGVMADFDKFNEITNHIAQISRMISSINTLKPQLLSTDNFAEIKKAIAEKMN